MIQTGEDAEMEQMQPGGKHTEWSGALVIVRDALIFLLCLLTLALVYFVSPESLSGGTSAKATAQTSAAVLSENVETLVPQTIVPQTNAVLSATATTAQTPSPAPEPTPSPTPDPAANGDFSATFPTYDTGADALYSYQTDTVKIAIDKVQSDGVTYFVADVYVKSIDAFKTAFAKDSYGRGLHEMPLKIAGDNNAVFAVSGDYYGAREQGVVVRNGILYRDVMGDDVCMLRKDGTLRVYQKSLFSPLDMLDDTVWQAWAFGPVLVQDGAACDTSSSRIKVKNPRSAIGYYAPGHYCFIVVDGRQNGYSTGMTLDELANTFVSLGCVTAYNLDGGATAMMVFDGAVISQPTNGGRSSSDIIYF
ncbi:MAG TPA: phosphodiester glycosidase family protein [Eubacteriales bacterium]|nr:phosphodiester glycosidase family protein [Eubacteriales bacterium]